MGKDRKAHETVSPESEFLGMTCGAIDGKAKLILTFRPNLALGLIPQNLAIPAEQVPRFFEDLKSLMGQYEILRNPTVTSLKAD